jgi:hypothetical protein
MLYSFWGGPCGAAGSAGASVGIAAAAGAAGMASACLNSQGLLQKGHFCSGCDESHLLMH